MQARWLACALVLSFGCSEDGGMVLEDMRAFDGSMNVMDAGVDADAFDAALDATLADAASDARMDAAPMDAAPMDAAADGSLPDGAVDSDVLIDTGTPDAPPMTDPFADRVVSFTPGAGAGFGEDDLPDVVLGPPEGAGASAGSLDVLSLGDGGCIVLEFTDLIALDGAGVDLLVFENPFVGFPEPGIVSVSIDGEGWSTFPCASDQRDEGFPGCAGTQPVFSSSANGIDATDPSVAGGDGFDLADAGLERARFVRVCDAGVSMYAGISGGFDLDAVAVVNGEPAR